MDSALKIKLDEANKLIFVRQYKSAEKMLKSMITAPNSSHEILVHLRYIELMVKLKKSDELLSWYEAQLAKSPSDHTLKISMALANQFSERVSPLECVAIFQEFIQKEGPSSEAFFGMALALEAQGSRDRAQYDYEQSIRLNSQWFPSYFALSQLHYAQGRESQGDHYFYLFEENAPYNVYGNFETHRRLFQEFLGKDQFVEAEAAISTLTGWWYENKGSCPMELTLFESLCNSTLSDKQGDLPRTMALKGQISRIVKEIVSAPQQQESVLFFCAKILEDHGYQEQALEFYQKILQANVIGTATVQRVGSYFLTKGDFLNAERLFVEAYQYHPDNQDIRFCKLVAQLKKNNVNVEEYLLGKERLKRILSDGADRVEVLSLLHSLAAKCSFDPDVQSAMGDMYAKLANHDRAQKHYEAAFELDPLSKVTRLRFAAFLLQHEQVEKGSKILKSLVDVQGLSREEKAELSWLTANLHFVQKEYDGALHAIRKALTYDAWNTSFLVRAVTILTEKGLDESHAEPVKDSVLEKLALQDEQGLLWNEYDSMTRELYAKSKFEICYLRQKIRFLYSPHTDDVLVKLLEYAKTHDSKSAAFDLMKLLNTNFDSVILALSIASLNKDLWQLETSLRWLEYAAQYPEISSKQKAFIYLEMADCLTWLDKEQKRALELAHLSVEMGLEMKGHVLTILAHSHIKAGQMKQAQEYLDQEAKFGLDAERVYLQGLIQYRNGALKQAKQIWKPLLSTRTDSLRFHHIKQDVMRYYFDGEAYLKNLAN